MQKYIQFNTNNKNMKKSLILVFSLLSTCTMWGKQLSQSEALDIARNFSDNQETCAQAKRYSLQQ